MIKQIALYIVSCHTSSINTLLSSYFFVISVWGRGEREREKGQEGCNCTCTVHMEMLSPKEREL